MTNIIWNIPASTQVQHSTKYPSQYMQSCYKIFHTKN